MKEYIERNMAEQVLIKEAARILRETPRSTMAEAMHRMIEIVQKLPAADVVEVEKVAEMLWYMFGHDCACAYKDICEWIPEACNCLETECPAENHACWKKFIRYFQQRIKDGDRNG